MGLDMYLYKKRYTKNWDHTPEDRRWVITIKRGDGPTETINPTYVIEEIAVWRKANQIHTSWYLDDLQYTTDAIKSILDSVLEDDYDTYFEYSSSW